MLQATLAKRLGAFALEVELAVDRARTLVVLGESGAGKTTILRLLAGVMSPDAGTISLDGEAYFAAGVRTVPAWRRDVGYVPQDYALFPHLTARRNVAFGLRASGLAGADIGARVDRALERFGATAFANRRPHELSGGQQQRIALARSLVLEPRLLLLDEPLSALDRKSRGAVREELHGVLRANAGATILVTHSEEDARVLADQVLTIDAGRAVTR